MFFQYLKRKSNGPKTSDDLICCVGQIIRYVVPAPFDERAINVLDRFLKTPTLRCLPVLKQGRICGLINRYRFMETQMVGKYGFGHSLNYYKTIESLLEDDFLEVNRLMTIEEVAKLVQAREHDKLYDDVCVTDNDCYLGMVSVSEVLTAIMENNLILAVGANPLSGLPGNDFIQRELRELLARGEAFDICYIDIDFFKPFNDAHGFARGDEVIKTVAEIMVDELARQTAGNTISFAGHIGGDDFILVTTPQTSVSVCQGILKAFDEQLPRFHGRQECGDGFYESTNRKGELERYPLLALSIAIVSTEQRKFISYAEISSVASGLKKKAKQQPGSVVLRDQRLV